MYMIEKDVCSDKKPANQNSKLPILYPSNQSLFFPDPQKEVLRSHSKLMSNLTWAWYSIVSSTLYLDFTFE